MGSIISPPKAPSIVYTMPASQASAAPGQEETAEESAARARRADLLQRERGMFGTIQTGFRGLLDVASQGMQRKTLLGE